VGLTAAQLGTAPIRRAARGIPVLAWVPWTDGSYHQVEAFAGEWTAAAVHLRWCEGAGIRRDVWVWLAGVTRRPVERPRQ
jgi:hypothetical protein